MQLSFNPTPFDLLAGVVNWLIIVGIAGAISLVAMFLMSLAAMGLTGPVYVVSLIKEGFVDLFGTSPRRVAALTLLTFREAVRRKALWVFGVFAVLFLFAGWFMSDVTLDAEMQVKNYVSFVLRTITWLIVPVVLLLSCWGLPEDIKARSLHTVVTKPVRKHEIVLGRILGFAGIGAVILGVMSVIGYFWVVRQLPESMGSQLVSRVPIYGEMSFLDREGNDKDPAGNLIRAGVNVGDENMFRSFVEGNTKARAIWDFDIDASRLEGGGKLVLESAFQSFRTYKGNIEKELLCQYALVNQDNGLRVLLKPFYVHEFRRNTYDVLSENDNELVDDKTGKPVDLAKDLLAGGKLRVEAACLSSSQFLGMARPDLFVRLPDRPFSSGYFKSIAGVGLMMVMIVVLGVMSGCFLKGPVATMLTAFVLVVGRMAHAFLDALATGFHKDTPNFEMKGRGLLESLIRIPTHKTPSVELEDTALNRVIRIIDGIELNGLWAIRHLFPDFTTFDTTEYVANSFDVPWSAALLPSLAVTVGFCIPWMIVGYFSLKVRELEAK